ncbi:MAG: hemerythrin domain-containing protein [Proteobacteria bacterium]|nr:MAG: hemerythrin domain-containing protein [Pseudomonadota bacterium]
MATKSKSKSKAKAPAKSKAPAKKAPAKKAAQQAAKAIAKKQKPAARPKQSAKASKAKESKFDIIKVIEDDHKPLKKLIKILTSDKKTIDEKRDAYEEFAHLLLAHARPEEQSMYAHMHENQELNAEAYEGETEHDITDQLISDIDGLGMDEEDEWEAKVKVLGELVEHHIEEEEEEMLPTIKKQFNAEMREHIGREFLRLKEEGVGVTEEGYDEE